MFKLKTADVHYGSSTYPLTGLEDHGYGEIQDAAKFDKKDFEHVIGHLTGFPREFRINYMPRQVFTTELHGLDLVLPERIVAIANGYTVSWWRE